jgi:uncharacterized protein HemX
MDQVSSVISTVLSDNSMGISLKIALLFLGLGIYIFIKRNMSKFKQDAARSTEQSKEVETKKEMTDTNLGRNEQAQSDSKNIDDFLKGEK